MKLKPILIKSDGKSYKSGIYLDEKTNKITKHHTTSCTNFQYYIILIDTEAEIVESDAIYLKSISKNGQIGTYSYDKEHNTHDLTTSDGVHYPFSILEYFDKIITSKLSPQSIQLLINYYNEHKCMPESVEVEVGGSIQEFQDYCGSLGLEWNNMVGWVGSVKTGWRPNTSELEDQFNKQIKLNKQGEVDITMPEETLLNKALKQNTPNNLIQDKKLYTEEEVKKLYKEYQTYLMLCEEQPLDLIDWFNKVKK